MIEFTEDNRILVCSSSFESHIFHIADGSFDSSFSFSRFEVCYLPKFWLGFFRRQTRERHKQVLIRENRCEASVKNRFVSQNQSLHDWNQKHSRRTFSFVYISMVLHFATGSSIKVDVSSSAVTWCTTLPEKKNNKKLASSRRTSAQEPPAHVKEQEEEEDVVVSTAPAEQEAWCR